MKKINTYIILIIIVFSSHILGAQTISKVDLILKEVSNELNKLLPSQINENSKVLSVVAIGNKTLLYSITIKYINRKNSRQTRTQNLDILSSTESPSYEYLKISHLSIYILLYTLYFIFRIGIYNK